MSNKNTPGKQKWAILLTIASLLLTFDVHAKNHYETLGVSRDATAEVIRSAYQKLVAKYHPDRLSKATKDEIIEGDLKIRDVNIAYEILGNYEKRAAYNSTLIDSSEDSGRGYPSGLDRAKELMSRMSNPSQLSPADLLSDLAEFNSVLGRVITSENKELYAKYARAMDEIARHPKFATIPILKSLMVTTIVQDFTFGLNMHLNYWESGFNTDAVTRAAGQLLSHLADDPGTNAMEVLNELVARGSTPETIDTDFTLYRAFPKFDLAGTQAVYAFAVGKGLIKDASSLRQFAKQFAEKIFDHTTRNSITSVFFEAQIGYTLSTLRRASYEDVLKIVSALRYESQGLAFEELVRNGRLARMSAEQVLEILERSKVYAEYWKNNRNFGPDYNERGLNIAARVRRASLAFARDFQKKSPDWKQARRYIELSELNIGEYTWSRVSRSQLPQRDYAIELVPIKVAKVNSKFALSNLAVSESATRNGLLCRVSLK